MRHRRKRRWPAARRGPYVAGLLLSAALVLGCGRDPEQTLLGRWREVEWRYDKFDGPVVQDADGGSKWVDGFRFPRYAQDEVIRHEAEYWEFKPDRVVEIALRDGRVIHSRWRLKGRGHVLTLRHPDSDAVELYDVKDLTKDELVLNYDIGMEVRGIARLRFRKAEEEPRSDGEHVEAANGDGGDPSPRESRPFTGFPSEPPSQPSGEPDQQRARKHGSQGGHVG